MKSKKTLTRFLNVGDPSPFFAYSDEWAFFNWLKRIKAIKHVVGTPKGLRIEVNDPIDDSSLMDLIALLTRYSMSKRCLSIFSNPKNAKWFKKSGTFWFRDIFREAKPKAKNK